MTFELNFNSTMPIEDALAQVSIQVPILFPSLVLMLYGIIVLVGAFAQKKNNGWVNLWEWLAVGGFISTISAFILFLVEGLVPLTFVITLLASTLVFTLIFFLTDD